MSPGRVTWFLAGAGVGAYAAFRARRLAEALSPDGMRDRAEAVRAGARVVAQEVSQARVDKETELRERFGLPSLEVSARSAGDSIVELVETTQTNQRGQQ